MLSYDHQGWGGGGGGVGGCINVLTSTSFTLRKMQTLHMLSVASKSWLSKIIPTKGSSWPKSTTNKISLLRLRLIIFEVVCGIDPIEPLLLVLNKWMEHGNTWKNGDLRRCSTKKKRVQKKVHLGLQLDMASQRCLVADCGFCVATSALAPLASRRGKNWKSECRPDMIRMIENHKFLMFFLTLEEQNRVTAQAKRTFSLLSHTPANRNECPCCKHFLTTPANTSILSLSLKNQNFKFVTLTRAPSQPVAKFLADTAEITEVIMISLAWAGGRNFTQLAGLGITNSAQLKAWSC